ncbi:MAG: RHS repeat-associated core domain-containing protein [Bacteroidota bacterium]
MQDDHYYPFGMRMAGVSSFTGEENRYRYNGKELHTELDLGWYDYGARMYDPSIARWNGVDALADSFLVHSPYTYSLNNPIRFIDPDGNSPDDIIIRGVDKRSNTFINVKYVGNKAYYANGTEYKGGNEFIDQVIGDLNQVKSEDAVVKKKIESLESSERTHKIQHTRTGGFIGNRTRPESENARVNGTPTGSTIFYDPENRYPGDYAGQVDEREPRVGLTHEVSHSDDLDKGNDREPRPTTENGIPLNEVRAINLENRVRSRSNQRTTYYGKRIPDRYLRIKQ